MDAYDRLVNTASTQAPAMYRVTPGSLDDSYLWRKLEGTHADAGGSGGSMPQGGTLADADMRIIQGWIQAGAPRD